MNVETARAQAEPLFPGDWERYERMLAYTDAEAIAPDSLDAATIGGWAWWAELLVDAVLAAPPEDRDRVAARQMQAIYCALRLPTPSLFPLPYPGLGEYGVEITNPSFGQGMTVRFVDDDAGWIVRTWRRLRSTWGSA